ncbi:FAD-dependent oxidoreductase [Phaeovulum sp. NW3]|uniref:FAD-dependent oxidoreductase n=1 Tax=Phaeovulum sp. NW3 TaxID=2934933 RepID=UPI00202269F7|nr:FAD-dependent oxidoreductase [Phaeovulum sp. NW3]MCL7466120.1 FAD-dependent oxidoreductase [Phaeovulum sp. NW3]
MSPQTRQCDVLVIGTGGAGLTAAITAKKAGLSVLIAEKDRVFGGTTATSGGGLWVPGTGKSAELGEKIGETDSRERAQHYLEIEAGQRLNPAKIAAFLDDGPRMIEFLERETHVRFMVMPFPDYHSEQEGASSIRSLFTVPISADEVGPALVNLKRELPQTSFLGMTMRSGAEVQLFFSATRSFGAFRHVSARMLRHIWDMLRHGESRTLTTGRALVARLGRSAHELGIPMLLSSPARALIREGEAVTGAMLETPEGPLKVTAGAVILAAGGYARDPRRRLAEHPEPVNRLPLISPVPAGNTGDSANMAEAVGARFQSNGANAGAWMPVSQMPGIDDFTGVWPHLVDRYKPGFIIVLPDGKRCVNESASYNDLGEQMIAAMAARGASHGWIIGEGPAVRRWGIGFQKPWPIPQGKLLRNGYLLKANSLEALARKAGIDPETLTETVATFNSHARNGEDPAFHRGRAPYDRYHGDASHKPNPALGPLASGPYYAVKIHVGEIGNFKGIATDENAQVLDRSDRPIPCLYAVGNDMANAFGGSYPGAGGTLGPGMTFAYRAARHAASALSAKR